MQPNAKSDFETRIEALEKKVYKTSKSENKIIKKNTMGPLRFELRIPAV